jgi:hypothetical protein
VAPQAGLGPATLRLTGGKNIVSRALLSRALRCRNVRPRSGNGAIFGPSPSAARCRHLTALVVSKGQEKGNVSSRHTRRRRRSVLAKDGVQQTRQAWRSPSPACAPQHHTLAFSDAMEAIRRRSENTYQATRSVVLVALDIDQPGRVLRLHPHEAPPPSLVTPFLTMSSKPRPHITAIASISIIQSGCASAEISTSVDAGPFFPRNSSRSGARSTR